MFKSKIKILTILSILPIFSNAFAGYDFSESCGRGTLIKGTKVDRIYAASLPNGMNTTVHFTDANHDYHYSIHKDNPYITELAKIAYMTNADVDACIMTTYGGRVDELIGIFLGDKPIKPQPRR